MENRVWSSGQQDSDATRQSQSAVQRRRLVRLKERHRLALEASRTRWRLGAAFKLRDGEDGAKLARRQQRRA